MIDKVHNSLVFLSNVYKSKVPSKLDGILFFLIVCWKVARKHAITAKPLFCWLQTSLWFFNGRLRGTIRYLSSSTLPFLNYWLLVCVCVCVPIVVRDYISMILFFQLAKEVNSTRSQMGWIYTVEISFEEQFYLFQLLKSSQIGLFVGNGYLGVTWFF